MASRRALVSSALRASSAIRPARPVFALACRAASVQRIQPLVPRASVAARWFSTEDTVPGSKIWEFAEIKKQVEEGKEGKVVIVDVREPRELFHTGKIPGAINIPITSAIQSFHISEEDFEDVYGFERPPKDAELLFYCKAGVRARAAAGLAKHAGWENVGEYPGSWLDWEAQNGPVEKVENKEDGYSAKSQ
ncbi:hypothetical protein CEP54_000423 [Fusarium duplospermum]|uniref:Rhodanese domain-containing protein n=1 Tax=Fusarium duplospermum TaxID=1325734 RepID=A0A428R6J8_9HYPO|nr:hypothetical protein CEP54_000423 [Fusarium duplospermum]